MTRIKMMVRQTGLLHQKTWIKHFNLLDATTVQYKTEKIEETTAIYNINEEEMKEDKDLNAERMKLATNVKCKLILYHQNLNLLKSLFFPNYLWFGLNCNLHQCVVLKLDYL